MSENAYQSDCNMSDYMNDGQFEQNNMFSNIFQDLFSDKKTVNDQNNGFKKNSTQDQTTNDTSAKGTSPIDLTNKIYETDQQKKTDLIEELFEDQVVQNLENDQKKKKNLEGDLQQQGQSKEQIKDNISYIQINQVQPNTDMEVNDIKTLYSMDNLDLKKSSGKLFKEVRNPKNPQDIFEDLQSDNKQKNCQNNKTQIKKQQFKKSKTTTQNENNQELQEQKIIEEAKISDYNPEDKDEEDQQNKGQNRNQLNSYKLTKKIQKKVKTDKKGFNKYNQRNDPKNKRKENNSTSHFYKAVQKIKPYLEKEGFKCIDWEHQLEGKKVFENLQQYLGPNKQFNDLDKKYLFQWNSTNIKYNLVINKNYSQEIQNLIKNLIVTLLNIINKYGDEIRKSVKVYNCKKCQIIFGEELCEELELYDVPKNIKTQIWNQKRSINKLEEILNMENPQLSDFKILSNPKNFNEDKPPPTQNTEPCANGQYHSFHQIDVFNKAKNLYEYQKNLYDI